MKTVFVIIMLLCAIFGYYQLKQVEVRDTEIVALKKQLTECNTKYDADIAIYKKCNQELIIKVSAYEVQIKELQNIIKNLQSPPVIEQKPQKIDGQVVPPAKVTIPPPPPVIKVNPNAEKIRTLEASLSSLKGKSLDLYNKKISLENKLKLESSRLLSGNSTAQFWYYEDEGSGALHPDNGKYDPRRKIRWVTKSKTEKRADASKPIIDEIASVVRMRGEVESQIKTIESQLNGLR